MNAFTREYNVDAIVGSFWKHGYMTLSRKFGSYLPEPARIGNYEVDAIGKYKNNYVIGITLNEEELNNLEIYRKLEFLGSRNVKYSNRKVKLFVAVPRDLAVKARNIISTLTEETRKNIKLIPIDLPAANWFYFWVKIFDR